MLELGKAGSAGTETGVLPVLRDGAVVATLRASSWTEAATAVIGGREWVFARQKRSLSARWAAEPEGAVRLRAWKESSWSGTWAADLEGTPVEVHSGSWWRGTRRYLTGGRPVAESGTTGGWSPRTTLTADDSLPLDHQVFLLYVDGVIGGRSGDGGAAVFGDGGGDGGGGGD